MSNVSSPSNGKRRYHAPVRQQQAQETRNRILDAARVRFRERGFAHATIEAIAEAANVSAQTVYLAFGSKRQLLTALVRRLKEDYALLPRVEQLIAERDPRAPLALAANVICDFEGNVWDVLDVLEAAEGDPELQLLLTELSESRWQDQHRIVTEYARRGILKPGLTTTVAADIFWALGAQDLCRRLMVERGWDRGRYEQWLYETLISQLLTDAARESPE